MPGRAGRPAQRVHPANAAGHAGHASPRITGQGRTSLTKLPDTAARAGARAVARIRACMN